ALGLLAVMATAASAQGVAPSSNQMTADAVAGSLRSSRALSGHRIEIMARDGVVTLSGTLASPAQKSQALARARRVAGVSGVVDQLQVAARSVRAAQYQPALALGHRNYDGGASMYDAGAMAPAATGPAMTGGPMPEGPAGTTSGTQGAMPGNPNYAWPSYAPYPN